MYIIQPVEYVYILLTVCHHTLEHGLQSGFAFLEVGLGGTRRKSDGRVNMCDGLLLI